MEIVKRTRCLECGGILELDQHHLSQKRHLECSYKKDKKRQKEYYEEFKKATPLF